MLCKRRNIKTKLIIVGKSEVSSANILTFDSRFSGRSFIKIRKNKGPKIDPCGTQATTSLHDEDLSLRTTLSEADPTRDLL